jgi:hypothetical protein
MSEELGIAATSRLTNHSKTCIRGWRYEAGLGPMKGGAKVTAQRPVSNIDPHPTLPRPRSIRQGSVGGFSNSRHQSVLSAEDEATIAAYADEHGVKEAADHFCVSQQRVADLQSRRRLEAMSS